MKRAYLGLLLGAAAGVIDVIPMIIQKLSWDANLSAFAFWVVAGFVISTSEIRLKGAVKGLVLSLILISPILVLIAWENVTNLVFVLPFTVVLGAGLGWGLDKLSNSV